MTALLPGPGGRDVLVVAATEAEAAHLPAGVDLLVTGVGKVNAAVATATHLAAHPSPERLVVLNVGTAGALHAGLTGLHLPGRVLNHDFAAAPIRALGLLAEDELVVEHGDATVLATGDLFVADPVVRDALAARAQLVDMEGFAVAWACHTAGVVHHLVKHVSDSADESAQSWPEVVDASAVVLGAWVEAWLG